MSIPTELYATTVRVTGGRGGTARSLDGALDVVLAQPPELGGDGAGTNPEQLLAAGFSACFLSALAGVARSVRVPITELTAESTVVLHCDADGYFLSINVDIGAADVSQDVLDTLVKQAEAVCPYARAVRGNIRTVIAATAVVN